MCQSSLWPGSLRAGRSPEAVEFLEMGEALQEHLQEQEWHFVLHGALFYGAQQNSRESQGQLLRSWLIYSHRDSRFLLGTAHWATQLGIKLKSQQLLHYSLRHQTVNPFVNPWLKTPLSHTPAHQL